MSYSSKDIDRILKMGEILEIRLWKTILEVVHGSAEKLHDVDLIDMQTMREFDAMCLDPVKDLTPAR